VLRYKSAREDAANIHEASAARFASWAEYVETSVVLDPADAKRFTTALDSALNALQGFAVLNGGTTDNDGFKALGELLSIIERASLSLETKT
jgi:hypothetical protein